MKEIPLTLYQCEVCGEKYETRKRAEKCESKPVTQDKGARVGSIVRVLSGDGTGGLAKVTDVYVLSMEWGHYAWERYWHTVAVNADLVSDLGSRMLTFDSYKIM